MSKRTNTLWFILGATLFNILLTLFCFITLLLLYARFLAPLLPEERAAWGFPVIFTGAMALSFVIYRIVLKQTMKKINFNEHLAPIFNRAPEKSADQ
ncbi:MAG: leader peptide processing enzyme [Treponema sp.]|jgi:hypothetical protein|nr:leader peptide processing enzyme [Treponema sp.]